MRLTALNCLPMLTVAIILVSSKVMVRGIDYDDGDYVGSGGDGDDHDEHDEVDVQVDMFHLDEQQGDGEGEESHGDGHGQPPGTSAHR